MKEKQRTVKENKTGGDDSPTLGVGLEMPESKIVHVASGPYAEDLPVAGMTVGEVRRRFSDRFDIVDEAKSIVDGKSAGEDHILKPNESLMFIHHAGEKGAKVVLDGLQATVKTPEGDVCSMGIGGLLERCSPGLSTGGILPTGVKAILSRGNLTLWFWERPPCVQQLSWIRKDSPEPYGPGAKYRNVRIALPYLVIMAAFARDAYGMPFVLKQDECFFRTEPLESLDGELSYPGLLNCSKYSGGPNGNNPLSWICTQYLKVTPKMRSPKPEDRFAAGLEAVRYCLLETSFNLSSEHHEGNSWYGASKIVIPQIETVERWESETEKNPLFVLGLPWIKTGFTIETLAERTFKRISGNKLGTPKSADDLARIIINSNNS